MLVLVTGGAGFIGSHIIGTLLGRHEVICLDNFDPYYNVEFKKKNIEPFLANENFKLVEGSILDKKLLGELTGGVEYIFHNAAQPGVRASVNDPLKPHEVNTTGTLNVLKASLDSGVKKVINASSSSVYGEVRYLPFNEKHPTTPVSPYGVSKLAAEHYCRVFQEVYGLNTVSLRYFTVFGPHMRPDLAISIFIRKALKNEPIEIFGDGEKTRDFTYIYNVVEANLLAMKKGKGEYNIGSGRRISVNDLAGKILSLTGSSSEIIYRDSVQGDAMHTWADIGKARKDIGYTPKIDLDKGLEKFLIWYKETNV